MKKLGSYLVVMLLSCFCLTSCFEGSNVEDGTAIGILDYSKNYSTIIKSTIGYSYAPNLDAIMASKGLSTGDCCIFLYSLDHDLPENAPNVAEANGYQTISLMDIAKLPKYYMVSHLTDTSSIIPGEIAVSDPYESGNYIESHLFISQIVNQPTDLQVEWNMSYDANTMAPTEVHGERFYDIFIRATKKNDSSNTPVNTQHLNAYYINRYLQEAASREYSHNSSTSKFTLRINYVSKIDADTKAITWSSKTTEIMVSSFLEN